MDYEKAYKDALERMKSWAKGEHPEYFSEAQKAAEFIFPELTKSEDERIRQKLIKTIGYFRSRGIDQQLCEKFLAWLEKQGDYNRLVEEIKKRKELISKEKDKATSTNDKLSLGGRIAILEELLAFTNKKQSEQKPTNSYCQENCKGFQETGKCFADGECKAKREAEQKPAWGDDDEEMKRAIIDNIFVLKKMFLKEEMQTDYNQMIEWLKSLKPQPHWKPTEEQLGVLQTAMRDYSYSREYYIIESLYNDIKKL